LKFIPSHLRTRIVLFFLLQTILTIAALFIHWKDVHSKILADEQARIDILAHLYMTQFSKALDIDDLDKQKIVIDQITSEIMLFIHPISKQPMFKGLEVELSNNELLVQRLPEKDSSVFVSEVLIISEKQQMPVGLFRLYYSGDFFTQITKGVQIQLVVLCVCMLVASIIIWFLLANQLKPLHMLFIALKDWHPKCIDFQLPPINKRCSTEIMRVHEAIKDLLNEHKKNWLLLEQRVEERTRELKQARDEATLAQKHAEAASKAKSEFLANISHEIRTPLNSIVGFSQILINKSKALSIPDSFKQFLKNIQISGENLSELINNILDISKIEAGKMELSIEPLNIRTLIQSIYHINKAQALKNNIQLNYHIDPTLPEIISSDRTKLNQILMNLVGNAIKFTPAHKKIQIKVFNIENQTIEFQIIDQGIGIPKDRHQTIFGLFEQVDSSISRQFGGTGLGLAIVKKLVTLLEGEVWLTSQPNHGSTFFVRVPLVESFEIINASNDINDITPKDYNFLKTNRILVVEDNPMNQEVIHVFFQELGLDVELADNGHMGIEKTLQLKPDLILMDMHMPGMDGISTIKQIRLHPEVKDVPIVALSADAFAQQRNLAQSVGVVDYLTKPLNFQQLYPVLDKYLRKVQTHKSTNKSDQPLPDHLKLNMRLECDRLATLPFYDAAAILDQLTSMMEKCEPYNTWYMAIFKKIEKAVFQANEALYNQLIEELNHVEHSNR